MKLSALKTDVAKLEAGQWVGDIPEMEGLELRVRGLGNTDYKRLYEKKAGAIPKSRKMRGIAREDHDRIVGECLHEAVLLDWRGLKNDDDSDLPFDGDLAAELLSKPEFAKFRGAVIWAANLVSEEASESIEADAKN